MTVTGLMCAKNEGSHALMKNYRENEITFNEVTLFDRSGTLENDLFIIKSQECGVFITYYDMAGNIIGGQYVSSDQATLEDCQKFHNLIKFLLKISGFWVT